MRSITFTFHLWVSAFYCCSACVALINSVFCLHPNAYAVINKPLLPQGSVLCTPCCRYLYSSQINVWSHTLDKLPSFPSVTSSFIQINNELLTSAFKCDLRLFSLIYGSKLCMFVLITIYFPLPTCFMHLCALLLSFIA